MASSAAKENDDDDDWLEDDSPGFSKTVGGHGNSSSIAGELGIKNEGYRIGKERITQKMIQADFDTGYARGMQVGRLIGRITGTVRARLGLGGKNLRSQQNSEEDSSRLEALLKAATFPLDDALPELLRKLAEPYADMRPLFVELDGLLSAKIDSNIVFSSSSGNSSSSNSSSFSDNVNSSSSSSNNVSNSVISSHISSDDKYDSLTTTTVSSSFPPATPFSYVAPAKIALLFDVDGTIVSSTDLCFKCTNAVLSKNGYSEISDSQYHAGALRFSTRRRFGWHACQDPDSEVGNALGDQFDEMYISEVSESAVPMYEGLKNILSDIKRRKIQASKNKLDCLDHSSNSSSNNSDSSSSGGSNEEATEVVLGLLSNAASAYVEAVCKAHGIEDLFEVRWGFDDVDAPKPSPLGLLQLASRLGVPPSLCLYVGDAFNDGRAAKAAGIWSVYAMWDSKEADAIKGGAPASHESSNTGGGGGSDYQIPPFDAIAENINDLKRIIEGFIKFPHCLGS